MPTHANSDTLEDLLTAASENHDLDHTRAGSSAGTNNGARDASGFREYTQMLWRRRITIAIVTVICVALTLGYCLLITPTYEAAASVLLEPAISQTLLEANYPSGLTQIPDVPDGIEVIESSSVARMVQRELPGAPRVTAAQEGTTDVVQISARSTDATSAAKSANAYARAYITLEQKQTSDLFTAAEQQLQSKIDTDDVAISNLNTQIRAAGQVNVDALENQLGSYQSQQADLQNQLQNYQFFATQGIGNESGQVISAATVPSKPVSPKTIEWTVLALIFGIILGIGVVLLINALSPERN
jgi:uncharacterized protein involved in exopolysaccharide biosynthesis